MNRLEDRSLPSTVSGTVYYDANANGVQDTGEAGISGIVVTLIPENGSPVLTATTDANGNYAFGGVAPGAYVIGFPPPSGYTVETESSDLTSITVDTQDQTVEFGLIATPDSSGGVGGSGSGSGDGTGDGGGTGGGGPGTGGVGGTGSQSGSITVQFGNQQNVEGDNVNAQVQASDSDGDALTYKCLEPAFWPEH